MMTNYIIESDQLEIIPYFLEVCKNRNFKFKESEYTYIDKINIERVSSGKSIETNFFLYISNFLNAVMILIKSTYDKDQVISILSGNGCDCKEITLDEFLYEI